MSLPEPKRVEPAAYAQPAARRTHDPNLAHSPRWQGPSRVRDDAAHSLLWRVLRDLRESRRLTTDNWDLLIRQARAAGLLGRLAIELQQSGLIADVPPKPRIHLDAESKVVARHERDVRWEVRCIGKVLGSLGVPIVLLKGAAYVMGALPAACGRSFTDVDIMVPIDSIERVEAALHEAGWRMPELTAYDERYYRQWTHQIPPMYHPERGIVIDVHHTIVARTTRLRLRAEKLFAAAIKLPDQPIFKILSPADMVLHSATHLLNGGDFDRGLRDLDDLNLLLRHFGADPHFWPGLIDRAGELDLSRPLYYALRYTAELLCTPIPGFASDAIRSTAPHAVGRVTMDALYWRALRPRHPSSDDPWSRLALWLLYVRAHHLLMPAHILIPHLVRKAVMVERGQTP